MAHTRKDKIRIFIVDDHQIVREGLKAFLGLQEDMLIAGEAGDGESALRQALKIQPDVILMDLILPKMDGITTIKKINEVNREKNRITPDELTERELEVLGCLAKGLSNQEIGNKLFISEKTVKTHVSSILSKLNLTDRTKAAIYAIKKGIS